MRRPSRRTKLHKGDSFLRVFLKTPLIRLWAFGGWAAFGRSCGAGPRSEPVDNLGLAQLGGADLQALQQAFDLFASTLAPQAARR